MSRLSLVVGTGVAALSSENKTVIRLIGGLGNQLFQLQFAWYLSGGRLCNFLFDESFFRRSKKSHERNQVQNIFKDLKFVELGWFDLKCRRYFEKLLVKYFWDKQTFIVRRYFFDGTDDAHDVSGKVIDGFWQSNEYLDLSFMEALRDGLGDLSFEDPGSVCVHIRRGDFLTNRHLLRKTQLVLGLDYYLAAMQFLRDKSPVQFHIYTDDESWCKNVFGGVHDVTVVPSCGSEPIALLKKMAAYRCFILANSTLGWWAANLSTDPKKIICSPRVWGVSGTPSALNQSDWVLF